VLEGEFMRASIAIDRRLLQQAMRLSGNRRRKATLEAGLRLLVQMHA
jgi:Arc/MetJ family transcription regulator